MDAQEILDKLKGHKGQHVSVTWERTLQTLRDVESVVVKRTVAYVRAGIDYANLAEVKEGIEGGEREEVGPLRGANRWVEFPFLMVNEKTGEHKIRLYPATFENLKAKRRTEYTLDGRPATFDEVRPLCRASEFSKPGGEPPLCFDIKAASILAVGD